MKLPSSLSRRPSRHARRVLAALALSASALPAFGVVNLTFDTDLSGFSGGGAAWSAKFGGSLSITNTSNWSTVAELGINGAVLAEINTMMTNGGVIEFDLIVDSDGLAAGDSVSPVVAANSSGGWDQENNFPRITADQVAGGPVTQRVSRLIMPNDPFINNDGEFHYASTSPWKQLNFGRSDSLGTTVYHIDNVTLRANSTPLVADDPFAAETIPFATDLEGFTAISWDTASIAYGTAFGGALQVTLPAATPAKSFWWICSASMKAKFAQRFNAAITGGGVLSYDLIAPTGTLATHTPFIYAQQGSGTYIWTQSGGAINPARIIDLGGGFEKTTIELTFASFGFALDVPYASLGFGAGRATDAPAIVYYIDNVTVTPAQRSAALAFNSDDEYFTAILDSQTKATDSTEAGATVTVADATGLSVGMIASGNVNLPDGATITAIAGTSVTLSAPATATAAGVNTTFTAPVNPTATWSETYGGTLALTAQGGPGESSRWVARSNLNENLSFNVALNHVLSHGGTVSYDLIADTGVLSTLKPRLFAQQQTGAWTWVSNEASATFIAPGDITALPSGREITRVTVPTSAFAAPLTNPYSLLGLGVTYTSATPVAFHVDNIQVETALTPTTAQLTFDATLEDFVPYLLGGVVHWTRVDSGASGNGKSLLISGAPRGQQWLARATLGSGATGAEAEAVGGRLASAAANGGSLTFDVVVDDFSVTNPTADFAASGLGVKLSLQTVGAPFQQKLFTIPATLPLPSGSSVVTTLTVPLYKAGSAATDGFVLEAGTDFEVLLGSVCPEKLIATADTTTTSGSAVVTLADTTGITVGLTVNGAGLPNAVTVASVDGPTQLTLSANATASGVIAGATYTEPVAERVDLIIDNLRVTANPDSVAPVISSPPTINLDGQWVAGRVLAAFADGATYAATGLPPGLSLDPATGILSGRPTANGSFTVTFTVTTDAGVATIEVSWAVTGAGTPNLVVTSFNVVAGAATIQWTGAAGTPVTVQRSTDLVTWINLAAGVTAETYTDPASPTPRAFYRVIIP